MYYKRMCTTLIYAILIWFSTNRFTEFVNMQLFFIENYLEKFRRVCIKNDFTNFKTIPIYLRL